MAVRVVAADVSAILDGTELTPTEIGVYIVSANALINEALGTGTTSILFEIERWLTAHMVTISRERQEKKAEAGGAKVEYSEIFGKGLNSTTFGQMVVALDTTGKMASLMLKNATIYAVKS